MVYPNLGIHRLRRKQERCISLVLLRHLTPLPSRSAAPTYFYDLVSIPLLSTDWLLGGLVLKDVLCGLPRASEGCSSPATPPVFAEMNGIKM